MSLVFENTNIYWTLVFVFNLTIFGLADKVGHYSPLVVDVSMTFVLTAKAQPYFWEHLGQWFRKGPASLLCSELKSTCRTGGIVISQAMWIRRKCNLKGVIYLTLLGLTNSTLICIMPPLLSLIHRRQSMKSLAEKHSISMFLPTIIHWGNWWQLNPWELCWHTTDRNKCYVLVNNLTLVTKPFLPLFFVLC